MGGLSQTEERLIEAVRKLPAEAAASLVTWAEQLATLSTSGQVQWSDSWSDEDYADAARATLARLDEQPD